ncbi:hypothetical protein GCM10008965_40160 [Methylorubrum aminovorans]|nr:hypothetical protein GCM10025880_21690 [Methylorubrum aminovorans]
MRRPVASVLAILLFLPVPLLQGLGYTGTCTQNDIDPFLTGAVLSLPFGTASLGLAWRSRRRARSHPEAGASWLICLTSLVLACLGALVLLMNADLARDTLLFGRSPCGAEHSQAAFEPEHVVIGAVYGAMPLAVLVTALAAFRAARSATARRA